MIRKFENHLGHWRTGGHVWPFLRSAAGCVVPSVRAVSLDCQYSHARNAILREVERGPATVLPLSDHVRSFRASSVGSTGNCLLPSGRNRRSIFSCTSSCAARPISISTGAIAIATIAICHRVKAVTSK